MPAPLPVRLMAGVAATAAETAFRLPYRLRRLPSRLGTSALTSAASGALQLRQNLTDLVARGDHVLEEFAAPTEEKASWATFDEDVAPNRSAAASAAGVAAARADDISTPERVAREVGYADMDSEDLEDIIPDLNATELAALSRYERTIGDRPAFRTLLDNALRG